METDYEEKALKYCDLSAPEDSKLELIGELLLQHSNEMEEKQVRQTGEFIHAYLKKKKALDHYFWGRFSLGVEMDSEEFQAEIKWIESFVE